MAGPRSSGGLFIEERQRAGASINRIRPHSAPWCFARIAAFVDRVNKTFGGMNREESWIRALGRNLRGRKSSGRGVESRPIDSLALRFGVGSEVDEIILGRC